MANKIVSLTDLNTANEDVLVQKLQISVRLVKRIIGMRPYESVEQLNKVWGMDPAVLQRIKVLINGSEDNILPDSTGKEVPTEIQFVPALVESPQDEISQSMEQRPAENPPTHPKAQKISWKTSAILLLILFIGAYFRFTGLNWDEGQHQHPDERYISMVMGQIENVSGIGEYFDTKNSPLNPLRFGSYTYGMFPLFFTHMIANWVSMSDYDAVTLAGRAMSGLFDLLAVWMLYILGKHLYDRRIGMIAAALGTAAVLPIQLSHFFTVDSFSTVFVLAAFYFAIQAVPSHAPDKKISWSNLLHFILFGIVTGLAGACKVNTLPVFGIIALAGIARVITDWNKTDFTAVLKVIILGWILSAFAAFLTFRIFQPYAFAGPGFLGLTLDENWLRVMREVIDHVAGNSDWPPNTHWTNRPITYAWINMVVWGMGMPLGLAGWLGFGWAGKRIWGGDWRRHLLPFVWVAAYFIWQNMQFWRYMRYFLPIYPFIILFAAWALVEVYDQTQQSRKQLLENGVKSALQFSDWKFTWKGAAGILIPALVLAGTYGYALAFTRIYNRPITRIAASEWMLENISAPLNVIVDSPAGSTSYPVAVGNRQMVEPGSPASANIHVLKYGTVSKISSTDIRQVGVSIYFSLTRGLEGSEIITDGRLAINDDDQNEKQKISFGDIDLDPGEIYYFNYKIQSSSQFSFSNISLKNVDENRPFLPVDLKLQSETGNLEGTVQLTPQELMTLNRLEINGFQQVFTPTETDLKISIYKDGGDQPLSESLHTLSYSQPGLRLSPTFKIPPVELFGEQTYQIRYEVSNGSPLHIYGDSFTLETSWDDALPLNINRYDVQGGIYVPLNLELYEPDTPEKRENMIRILDESNYIIIPSNRAYDAMPRLPLRYPLTLKYYQALFDCDCSGDELENRAYELTPPFKSPLGFDLIATFESPPSLGFVTFPDQWADESFTVYDHPKVMVFRKSEDFSNAHVSRLLNDVNLDQVVFQIPSKYTQAPTAMRLPANRILAQRNSTDWSAVFNRNSLINVNQFFGILTWYLLIFLLGLVVLPLVHVIFTWLPDRGYPFIRIAGLAATTWLVWIFGSFKIMPFSQMSIWLCIGLLTLLSIAVGIRQRESLSKYFLSQWKNMLWTEAIFLVVFLISLSIRLGNPDLWHPWLGGEKPMDFTFFNAVLRAVTFPPENPWFAGHYINYYYYGYIIAAIPTKLLGILPAIAYNLILPSWFAMTGIGMFSVAFNLAAGSRQKPDEIGQRVFEGKSSPRFRFNRQTLTNNLPYLAGASALVAVLFLGNLYQVAVLWRYLPEATTAGVEAISSPVEQFGAVIGGAIRVLSSQATLPGNNGRWYFEASRPILYKGPDTPIAEFPYFTFLYGDMHPHMLVMPIYGLVFAWILNLLLRPDSRLRWRDHIPVFIAGGLIFGVFRAIHTWDFPTFIGLGMLAVFWNTWRNKTNSIKLTMQNILIYELTFIGTAILFYLPFAQWFKTEYVSLEFWEGRRTPLVDYVFVFGMSLFVMITLLLRDLIPDLNAGYKNWISSAKGRFKNLLQWRNLGWFLAVLLGLYLLTMLWLSLWLSDYQVVSFGIPILIWIGYIIIVRREMPMIRQVMWVLFGIGLSITLFVEVFVLKGDSGRSNTVFRFYNQVWFIFGLATSLALTEILTDWQNWNRYAKYAWGMIFGVLLLFAASFPLIATNMKITDRWPDIQNPHHTLDGSAFMIGDSINLNPAIYNDDSRPINLSRDYAAIKYMQDNVSGSPVIIEGHTEEYRWGSRFSIYTGLPSVVGWSWHVRQHNSLLDGALIESLIEEVNNFYNTENIQTAEIILDKYQVQYIVVGDLERAYYNAAGINKFQDMVDQGILRIAFGDNSTNTTTILEIVK